jgi:heme exporter protein CcmB
VIDVLRAAWLIARKDIVVEIRNRELAYTTLFFAVACILVFAVAFVDDMGHAIPGAAAGILWVAIAFSGTLALGRTFERERQSETLRALLLSPIERPAVYLGKLAALLMLMFAVEAVVVTLVATMFQASLGRAPWMLLGLVVAGTVGFAAVGTLFAAMLARLRSRDVLLPMLLYPVTIPVVIAGVKGTQAIFAAEPNLDLAGMWLAMLISFDAVFITLSLWTFGPVMSE